MLAHGTTLSSLAELAGVVAVVCLVVNVEPGPRRRAGAAAAVVLAVAGSPPVHSWSERDFTGHMVQHLALIALAAPLLAAMLVDGRRAGGLHRRPVFQPVAGAVLGTAIRPPTAPMVAAVAHLVVLVFWHLPTFYDLALRHPAAHLAEHALLTGTALWWWMTVLHHVRRRRPLAPMVSLFVVATGCAVLGVALMFSPAPWFVHDEVADQQMAGALMTGSGFLFGLAALVLVAWSVRQLEQPRPIRVPPPSRLLSLVPVVLAVSALPFGAPLSGAPSPGGPPFGARPPGSLPAAPSATPDPGPDPTLGRDLYRRDCVACHGPRGEGSFRGVPIDDLGTASVRYSIGTGRMPIAEPSSPVRRSEPRYDAEAIDAIVAYTEGFVTGPAVPDLTGFAADLARGGELYRLHCSACHGATGIGGAQSGDRVAPHLWRADATDIAAAVVAGPGGMPAFGSTFDNGDLASLIVYVGLLQDPPTTGIPIRGDRVGEGLVAWLVGVGTLIVVVAWIGRTVSTGRTVSPEGPSPDDGPRRPSQGGPDHDRPASEGGP